MRPLLALLGLSACAPALRAVTKEEEPHRWALAAAAPTQLHRVLGVGLSVHDSEPSGTKPVLVCLHAIAHGGGDFTGVEARLGDSWRIITVDWPGHGRSESDTEPASATRYAQLFEALVGQLQLTRFVILGNSIGGAVAIRHAAAHPDQVRALVLANPGGLDPGGLLARLWIGLLVDHFEQGERNEARFEPWFRRYYEDILVTEEARPQRDRIVAAGYEHATVLAQAWRSFAAPGPNLVSLIQRVSMPVLFTWAKRDGLITWGRNRAAVEAFPRASVEFFEAGHAPFLESSEAFHASLTRFLAGLDR
ncbi:MAG: alpha/beta hydrolase [Archangium sp.]|nr:alpha/beta hydrolase [Archangium sp.]